MTPPEHAGVSRWVWDQGESPLCLEGIVVLQEGRVLARRTTRPERESTFPEERTDFVVPKKEEKEKKEKTFINHSQSVHKQWDIR